MNLDKTLDNIYTYGMKDTMKAILHALYANDSTKYFEMLEEYKKAAEECSNFFSTDNIGKYFKFRNEYFKILSVDLENNTATVLSFFDDVDSFCGINKRIVTQDYMNDETEEITELVFHIAYDKVFKYIPNL